MRMDSKASLKAKNQAERLGVKNKIHELHKD